MDFMPIQKIEDKKKKTLTILPEFLYIKSEEFMIRGKAFYAIWDEENNIWCLDGHRMMQILDNELRKEYEKVKEEYPDYKIIVNYLTRHTTKKKVDFDNFINHSEDNFYQLNSTIHFASDVLTKKDYASKRLSYNLSDGPCTAYNTIMSTLYEEEERKKIEWAIGSVFTGDSKKIQKFIFLYGPGGTGKSTVLDIIEKLFEGYTLNLDAKSIGTSSKQFSTAGLSKEALVAIQHDTDISKIDDGSLLNSIVSHEAVPINEKYKAEYYTKPNCFIFIASNKEPKIDSSKSGLIRRLISVKPSGRLIDPVEYDRLVGQIKFELGAIANHCIKVYQSMGKNYYNSYRPIDMMYKTDIIYTFVRAHVDELNVPEGITFGRAFDLFKVYCSELGIQDHKKPNGVELREELRNYFKTFRADKQWSPERKRQERNLFVGFKIETIADSYNFDVKEEEVINNSIDFSSQQSIFDKVCSEVLAQYANGAGTPIEKWEKVHTRLKDLDTSKLHYVLLQDNHIVIDFDLKDENGEKSLERNLEAASNWPETYTEVSKSGKGLHLHYIYDGDVSELSRIYSDGVEIKVFTGNSALRRKLTLCNNKEISHISSGLPIKEKEGIKMVDLKVIKSEKGLRDLILRNLRKEIHSGTKPSVDFIKKILTDAYNSGMKYDLTDMRSQVLAFANNSTNHASYCVKVVNQMPFQSDEEHEAVMFSSQDELVFYDVETFKNLFVVCWKIKGDDHKVVKMINPSPQEVERLFEMKLVGFNNLRYDDHLLYGRYLGYTNEQLYKLSQKLIIENKGHFREANNISYVDVWDFSASKEGLKKCEIELGIHHQELGLPWDQPVPEELWDKVADYCANDVIATEAVFNSRLGDFSARQILAAISGLPLNRTTNQHTIQIVFGNEKNPDLVYVDLAETFPGYEFRTETENGKIVKRNIYRDTDLGLGGYNVSIPGIYENVTVLDISSLHPHSIIAMNMFGSYTKRFKNLVDARVAIKHGDLIKAQELLGEKAAPFLQDPEQAKALAQALKISVNSVYGLTASERYITPFRDLRNINNIVALRGALFMRELQYQVENQDFIIVHLRTDSLKIPNASDEILDFITDFAKQYGYTFEFEDVYEKLCLLNDSELVAKVKGKNGKESYWKAVGLQFKKPYVFKTLFSKEEISINDLAETKAVKAPSSIYLDFNEDLPQGEHNYTFVGRVGCFCPVKEGCGGGLLVRDKGEKYDAVSGSKGYRWKEKEIIEQNGLEDEIDVSYYQNLVDEAIEDISKFGDPEEFLL